MDAHFSIYLHHSRVASHPVFHFHLGGLIPRSSGGLSIREMTTGILVRCFIASVVIIESEEEVGECFAKFPCRYMYMHFLCISTRLSQVQYSLTVQTRGLKHHSFHYRSIIDQRGHPWHSGSMLDCWLTGRAINCTWGMICNKIHLISPGCPRPSIALQCSIMT